MSNQIPNLRVELGCAACDHLLTGMRCGAYPERIPLAIQVGQVLHDKALGDQQGDLIWEPMTRETYQALYDREYADRTDG